MQGTTRMRTHVEVDPRVGLRCFDAIRQLKPDYAWAIDLELCVFPQEGLLNDPGTDELLIEACEKRRRPDRRLPLHRQRSRTARSRASSNIAQRFDLDIDFHLDFDLDPSWMHLDEVCRQTEAATLGRARRDRPCHQALGDRRLTSLTKSRRRLADAGVAVTVLPATDLFLMGRGHQHSVPRGVAPAHRLLEHGVTCSLATNNVLNPFTPFGDCSLIRMANLYANIARLRRSDGHRGIASTW